MDKTSAAASGVEGLVAKLTWAMNAYKLADARIKLIPSLNTAMSVEVEIADVNAKLGELVPEIIAALEPAQHRQQAVVEMREAGRFLLDRLVDHEVRMTSEDDSREWAGHVTPAMARFRAALQGDGA